MTDYTDIWYPSSDGLQLYARDYTPKNGTPPKSVLLCMHGLTRNSADFEDLSPILAKTHRCIVVDQRGRGKSAYDPKPQNYTPLTYMQDMFSLLDHLELGSVVTLGTSMGGIISTLMAMTQPTRVEAMIINDIGPEIPSEAIERLKKYVGLLPAVTNWDEAVEQTKLSNSIAFPRANEQDWKAFARRLYVENEQGKPTLAYDPNIKQAFANTNESESPQDDSFWPIYDQIINKPMLMIRGEISDLLAQECVNKLKDKKPDLQTAIVANVGHAPLLTEPEALSAILEFLAKQ